MHNDVTKTFEGIVATFSTLNAQQAKNKQAVIVLKAKVAEMKIRMAEMKIRIIELEQLKDNK